MGAKSKGECKGEESVALVGPVMEESWDRRGKGGMALTVWTPGRELSEQDREELHGYPVETWGATFVANVGTEGRKG